MLSENFDGNTAAITTYDPTNYDPVHPGCASEPYRPIGHQVNLATYGDGLVRFKKKTSTANVVNGAHPGAYGLVVLPSREPEMELDSIALTLAAFESMRHFTEARREDARTRILSKSVSTPARSHSIGLTS